MKARHKLVLWVAVLYVAVLGAAAALGVVLGAGQPPADQETLLQLSLLMPDQDDDPRARHLSARARRSVGRAQARP